MLRERMWVPGPKLLCSLLRRVKKMYVNGRVILAVGIIAAGIIIVLLALTIHGYTRKTGSDAAAALQGTRMEALVDDGLDLVWLQDINSRNKLNQALELGNSVMLEADVMLDDENSPVIMSSQGAASDLSLDQFLDQVALASDNNRGVLLNFKSIEAVEPAVQEIESRQTLTFPIWLRTEVVSSEGQRPPVDPERFISAINPKITGVTLALEWGTSPSEKKLGQGRAEVMWEVCKGVTLPISFFIPAAMVRQSWLELRWLLGKNPSFSLTIFASQELTSVPGVTAYDLLYIRNDWAQGKIFYDMPPDLLQELRSVSATAGSALHYFQLEDMDAAKITWAHAVNSASKLDLAIKEGILFLEADVRLQGIGTANQTSTPIMAHPPDVSSDLTLADFLSRTASTHKGLKLDFKDLEAVEPSLLQLKQLQPKKPVWLNADILPGPNSNRPPVNASLFLSLTDAHFPAATLSIGWTTGWSNSESDEVYTWDMVHEMHGFTKDLRQPITFPVRAAAVRKSWEQFDWLLQQSRGYTLTIWTSAADNVQKADMQFVRDNAERSRVYYDLPDELMPV